MIQAYAKIEQLYEKGKHADKRGLSKAVQLYENGTVANDERSMAYLGECYFFGQVKVKSEAKAFELFRTAVAKGDVHAI